MKLRQALNEADKFEMKNYWNDKALKSIPKVSNELSYNPYRAAAYAIELLTNVNYHEAAKVLDLFVTKDYAKDPMIKRNNK
ncbi:unnamed protein product [marine sediment metagenome]|uniref:Uncharacterized protein n=1 Tax=marine sediment metagenome TaxID=412755 RepID=X0RIH3_9ZZZZ